MNIPPEVARAQGHHGAKGAAYGIKGGRPRLALTDEERVQRRREQYTAYRRRKGIMPKQILTFEERQELHRSRLKAYWDEEYRKVWRKLPDKPLTANEFATRLPAFRQWVRDCQSRNHPLIWPVHSVRKHYREESRRQRAEARANDGEDDFEEFDDDFDPQYLQKSVEQQNIEHRLFEAQWKQYADALLGSPAPAVGRNEPCPCGSGRKFKKCCGR